MYSTYSSQESTCYEKHFISHDFPWACGRRQVLLLFHRCGNGLGNIKQLRPHSQSVELNVGSQVKWFHTEKPLDQMYHALTLYRKPWTSLLQKRPLIQPLSGERSCIPFRAPSNIGVPWVATIKWSIRLGIRRRKIIWELYGGRRRMINLSSVPR